MLESTTVQLALIMATALVLALFIEVGLPVGLSMRHARLERRLLHAERMKAMELGLPFPEPAPQGGDAELTDTRPWALAVWVPLAVFGTTLGVAVWAELSVPLGVWFAAACIGATGILCGSILLLLLPAATLAGSSPGSAGAKARGSKPMLDPDSFETVGRRG
jgi:hypothetical protein